MPGADCSRGGYILSTGEGFFTTPDNRVAFPLPRPQQDLSNFIVGGYANWIGVYDSIGDICRASRVDYSVGTLPPLQSNSIKVIGNQTVKYPIFANTVTVIVPTPGRYVFSSTSKEYTNATGHHNCVIVGLGIYTGTNISVYAGSPTTSVSLLPATYAVTTFGRVFSSGVTKECTYNIIAVRF